MTKVRFQLEFPSEYSVELTELPRKYTAARKEQRTNEPPKKESRRMRFAEMGGEFSRMFRSTERGGMMRIHDEDGDKSLDRIVLFLTPSEAKQLTHDLESILAKPTGKDHVHISSDD